MPHFHDARRLGRKTLVHPPQMLKTKASSSCTALRSFELTPLRTQADERNGTTASLQRQAPHDPGKRPSSISGGALSAPLGTEGLVGQGEGSGRALRNSISCARTN